MLLSILLLTQAPSSGLTLHHSHGPNYTRTSIESACGNHVVRIEYRNDLRTRGQVILVRINDRDVMGAARGLQDRAANRSIATIEIMNCGFDEQEPIISAVMQLSPVESQRERLPPRVYFRLRRQGSSWLVSWD